MKSLLLSDSLCLSGGHRITLVITNGTLQIGKENRILRKSPAAAFRYVTG